MQGVSQNRQRARLSSITEDCWVFQFSRTTAKPWTAPRKPSPAGEGADIGTQAADWIVCQIRCGVVGISIWVMP